VAVQRRLREVLEGRKPGLTAAVVSADGGWSGATGVDGAGRPLRVTSMMCVGSITKTFVAAEAVHLAGKGVLALDAPASAYVDHPLLERDPTVRQLLSMTSGLPEFVTDELDAALRADPARAWTAGEALGYAVGPPGAPGREFAYTNTNYLIVGQVIEKVTGLTWAAALRRDLIGSGRGRIAVQTAELPPAPLAGPGLHDGLRPDGRFAPNRAVASAAGPAGGLAADAPSLARWGYDLYGGRVLPPDQVTALTTGWTDSYGLGTRLGYHNFRDVTVGHDGAVKGYVSDLTVLPGDRIAVAVLVPADLAE
jgi:D-alanyl-D-alanine carboxypeptidase